MGNPASLINVTLPASSVLNLRSNSILAANGDLNNITSKVSILKLLTKPLIYNKISSTTPLSLILSNKGSNNYFINLELSENEEWTVFNTKNLVGWYGPELQISNSKIGVKLESGNNKSNVILNGKTQLFTLNLENEEKIYLNPKSIIAINAQKQGEFHKLNSSNLQLSIPKFKFLHSWKIHFNSLYQKISKYITPKLEEDEKKSEVKPIESPKEEVTKSFEIPQSLKSIGTWISTKFNQIILKDKVFYEVKGPATIIVQNSTLISSNKIFTNQQLTEIYKNLK